MVIKYCPKCHQEAYRLTETSEGVKVMQVKSTLLNIGKSSKVSMSVGCPNGHPVALEIK